MCSDFASVFFMCIMHTYNTYMRFLHLRSRVGCGKFCGKVEKRKRFSTFARSGPGSKSDRLMKNLRGGDFLPIPFWQHPLGNPVRKAYRAKAQYNFQKIRERALRSHPTAPTASFWQINTTQVRRLRDVRRPCRPL